MAGADLRLSSMKMHVYVCKECAEVALSPTIIKIHYDGAHGPSHYSCYDRRDVLMEITAWTDRNTILVDGWEVG